MKTAESNRLIAEFMNLPKVECNISTEEGIVTEGYMHRLVGVPVTSDGMQYAYSWDWLMTVVEKISTIDNYVYSVKINYCITYIETEHLDVICNEQGNETIEATYKAVVEFIKWYNENK